PAEQPQEVGPCAVALRLAREPQRRREQRVEQRLAFEGPARGGPLVLGEQRDALAVERVEARADHLAEQPLLAAEVIIDRGEVDARGRRQHAQRRPVEAVLEEQPLGGFEDAAARRLGRLAVAGGAARAGAWAGHGIQTTV